MTNLENTRGNQHQPAVTATGSSAAGGLETPVSGASAPSRNVINGKPERAEEELWGTVGDDVFNGGTGSDWLYGGYGDDTYVINRGDGWDHINENLRSHSGEETEGKVPGTDTLRFGAGIDLNDLLFQVVPDSRSTENDMLVIKFKDPSAPFPATASPDQGVYIHFWDDADSRVEYLEFADGTKKELKALYDQLVSRVGLEALRAAPVSVAMDASEVHGDGGTGDDTLTNTSADERFFGGAGSDTYHYDKGDGKDVIFEEHHEINDDSVYRDALSSRNKILFGANVKKEDLVFQFRQFGSARMDLYIGLKKEGVPLPANLWDASSSLDDVLVIANWKNRYWKSDTGRPTPGAARIQILEFSDGSQEWIETSDPETSEQITLFQEMLEQLLPKKTIPGNVDGIQETIYKLNPQQLQQLSEQAGRRLNQRLWQTNLLLRLGVVPGGPIAEYSDLANTITGDDFDNTLNGTPQTDRLIGGDGKDTLAGGGGADQLMGGKGLDTYVFNRGDGRDTVYDTYEETRFFHFVTSEGLLPSYSAQQGDVLRFGDGITLEDLLLQRVKTDESEDLWIGLKQDDGVVVTDIPGSHLLDVVRLRHWNHLDFGIERLEFADGTQWEIHKLVERVALELGGLVDVRARLAAIVGTEGNDRLNGTDVADTILGQGGKDILVGGMGDDNLYGGTGDDTYEFARGHGRDTIQTAVSAFASTQGYVPNEDKIHFLGDIRAEDLLLQFKDDDLLIGVRPAHQEGIPLESFADLEGSSLVDVIRIVGWRLSDWQRSSDISRRTRLQVLTFESGDHVLSLRPLVEQVDRYGWHKRGGPVIDLAAANALHTTNRYGWWDAYDVEFRNTQQQYMDENNGLTLLQDAYPMRHFVNVAGLGLNSPVDTGEDTSEGAYVFGFGSGRAAISGSDLSSLSVTGGSDTVLDSGRNTLRFGEGVTIGDVIFQRHGDDLFIALKPRNTSIAELNQRDTDLENTKEVPDVILLRGWGSNPSLLRALAFDGNVRVNVENLIELVGVGDENPIVDFDGESGVQVGNVNDDTLLSDNNINMLLGYEGTDELHGSSYNDHLWGGAGDDQLFGHSGDDTYWFNLGDGHDTITEFNIGRNHVDNNDRVVFGEGIGRDNLWLSRSGDDLVIEVIGQEDDRVTVAGHFDPSNNGRVERLELADGSHLGWEHFNSLIDAMARFDAQSDGLLPLLEKNRSAVRSAINESWVTTSSA